jgi:hypothetical protein
MCRTRLITGIKLCRGWLQDSPPIGSVVVDRMVALIGFSSIVSDIKSLFKTREWFNMSR